MWYILETVQQAHSLSEKLIRTICSWHYSGNSGNEDIEDLINQGADVNRVHGGLLPLHCAAMVSNSLTMRLLLQRRAQIDLADGYGRLAIHYAAEKDVESLQLLLEMGADVNSRDSNHDTPLHWAAFKNNLGTVTLLLQCGANPDATDYNNDTALSWAAHKGHLGVIRLLLDYNASVDIRNFSGRTPLHRAAQTIATGLNSNEDDACLDLLVKSSGQFDVRGLDGEVMTSLVDDNKLSEILLPFCSSPRSLRSLCRFQIRQSLGKRYLPNVIPKLPIPRQMAAFISLKS